MAGKLRGWGHYGELSSDNEVSGLSIDAHDEVSAGFALLREYASYRAVTSSLLAQNMKVIC
jgi:hypothetical protein